MNYIKTLEDCAKIAQERQDQYGEATDSIKLACNILKTTFNIELTPKEFCYVLVALKLSREHNQKKDDNILDSINYLAISLNL
jgi:hypothetical protein|tara:strand:+ start:501 stop:749 length:249 start_codon:yes stop_codon:yes gene_type:complete